MHMHVQDDLAGSLTHRAPPATWQDHMFRANAMRQLILPDCTIPSARNQQRSGSPRGGSWHKGCALGKVFMPHTDALYTVSPLQHR